MAWDHLSITRANLVYIIVGGFTSLFMLCSSIIKERLYIGEATVATICGIIFGPHAANLIDPNTWGNTDQITLEFCRIVLVVQCFAVGVELPKYYMERHWKSVVLLLVPVMTFGWMITSLFIWGLFMGKLNWLDSLCCAACVTATDPVLASSVVGKGKFAKRVPKHLRDLLSAESGCNDGMAFPFIYLPLYILRYHGHANEVALHWFCYTILYECIFGAVYGVCIGYIARRAIRYAHEHDVIDRESFLVFYFVLALFCAGSGSILGLDDLLVGFAAGVGFSNDGWFLEKTEESHVSNVIDLLINLAFFVYFGTVIPWAQYSSDIIGMQPWRLVVLSILVLLFRRIPIMLALKPIIPDIKTWREALFAGHFGPIGVGALFVAILARAELETGTTTPLAVLPEPGFQYLNIIEMIWPITTFLVITSIIVHGSSIAVFTLGKHINTLTITMSYTKGNEDGPNWIERLPRIQSRSRSQMSKSRTDDPESDFDEKVLRNSDGTLGPNGLPIHFLRKQRNAPTGHKGGWEHGLGPGGPISQSAISPQHKNTVHSDVSPTRSESDTLQVQTDESPEDASEQAKGEPSRLMRPESRGVEIYEEGNDTVIEDEEGNVLSVVRSKGESEAERRENDRNEAIRLIRDKDIEARVAQADDNQGVEEGTKLANKMEGAAEQPKRPWQDMKRKMSGWGVKKPDEDGVPSRSAHQEPHKRSAALAYQFGNTIIVEDEDGEVVKKYDIPAPRRGQVESGSSSANFEKTRTPLQRMGTWLGVSHDEQQSAAGPSGTAKAADERKRLTDERRKKEEEDDERIRFSVTAGGKRMSKAEFIQQMQKLDPKARSKLVEQSNVPETVKEEAREHAREHELKVARETQPGLMVMPSGEMDGSMGARLEKVGTREDRAAGPEGLTLIDSRGEDIPFYAVSTDLSRVPGSETAAQRRRREASLRSPPPRERAGDEDSDDDGTERVPPQPQRPTAVALRQPSTMGADAVETAAERRRREGALGITHQESNSDEDESKPRKASKHSVEAAREGGQQQPMQNESQSRGVRFADQPSEPARLRWKDDVVGRRGQ